jgi:hypothetical protein
MKSLLLLSLIVLGSFFIFDRFGSSNPSIENPTASTPTVPQSVLTASEGKSTICHLDSDTGGSKVIVVSSKSAIIDGEFTSL